MITAAQANHFAEAWTGAWNNHDLDAILEHYSDDIAFYSPFIKLLGFNETGMVKSKDDLRAYFSIGLKTYPDLHFDLHTVLAGVHSVTIYYTSVNNRRAAEVFELDERGKAHRVMCHYTG